MEKYSAMLAWSPEDAEYVATSPEFPGLSALGPSPAEALAALWEAIEIAVDAFVEDNEPLPLPRASADYSGQLRLRLPKWVHKAAAERAELEDVSLNALLQSFIAFGLSGAPRVHNPKEHRQAKHLAWPEPVSFDLGERTYGFDAPHDRQRGSDWHGPFPKSHQMAVPTQQHQTRVLPKEAIQ